MDDIQRDSHNTRVTNPIILLDAAMRMLAIGQILLIAVVIGRGRAPLTIRLATVWLLVGVAAYLTIATLLFRPVESIFLAQLQLLAQSVPLALWIFAHLLFEREIDGRATTVGAVALVGCWIGFQFVDDPRGTLLLIQRGVFLLFIAHAILIALRERGDDLIEKRRRLRVGFVIVVGKLAFVVIVLELLFGVQRGSPLQIGQALAILIATNAMGAALLQSDPELLFDPARPAPEPSFSPSEHVLNRKVSEAMAAAIYREPGLTIGKLADRMGVPEHRLRSLINQRLGYRNFSAFLNHHRVAEAKRLLADPAKVDLPVLTIAMDLGYGSLAPFNRAFRENVGQSPSEFRREAFMPN